MRLSASLAATLCGAFLAVEASAQQPAEPTPTPSALPTAPPPTASPQPLPPPNASAPQPNPPNVYPTPQPYPPNAYPTPQPYPPNAYPAPRPYPPRTDPAPPAESPPSNGTGLTIAGSILLGLGVLNLATAPLCKTDMIDNRLEDTCFYSSLALGGAMTAVGLPLLIVGLGQRGRYSDWEKSHPRVSGLRVQLDSGRAGILWRSEF